MNQTLTDLTWERADQDGLTVHTASSPLGPYDFEILDTPGQGWRLRMWQLRPGDSPLLFWQSDGYGLEEAQRRAAQLAAKHVHFPNPPRK